MKGLVIALLFGLFSILSAYEINGMYARLIKCEYVVEVKYTGYIGYYEGSDGKTYAVSFGEQYCPY